MNFKRTHDEQSLQEYATKWNAASPKDKVDLLSVLKLELLAEKLDILYHDISVRELREAVRFMVDADTFQPIEITDRKEILKSGKISEKLSCFGLPKLLGLATKRGLDTTKLPTKIDVINALITDKIRHSELFE